MKIKFWGVRGSIPRPATSQAIREKIVAALQGARDVDLNDVQAIRAYVDSLPPLSRGTAGGNTACIEIRAEDELLVIDAGSGLYELGLELMRGAFGRGQGRLHLFIGHLHWDHLQGFPMFLPAFVPGNRIIVYGIHDLKAALESQQNPLNWPVSLSYMQARASIEFVPLQAGQTVSIGPVRVNTISNPHPGDAYSFRFEDRRSVCVYASDVEYKQLDEPSLQPHLDFFRQADALIFDAQYTLRDVWEKVDWGHSSALIGIDLARAAGVKRLILFHHDPTHSDAKLLEILATATTYQAQDTSRPACEVMLAYEGLTLDLALSDRVDVQLAPNGKMAIVTATPVFDEHSIGQLAQQLSHLAGQPPGSIIDLSPVETLTISGLKALIALRQERGGSIALVAPSGSVQKVISLAGYRDYFAIYPSVEAALAAVQARNALNLPGHLLRGRYQIESKIGTSGLGDILKASDTHTGRPVALKLLAPYFSPETIDRFMRQVRQVARLDHPNIVRVLACDQEGAYAFIVEEWVSEPTLQQYLDNSGAALPAEQIMNMAMDITRALEYAHGRGIVHGDLKPANIFWAGGKARLSGLELGRLAEGRNLLETPVLFQTAAYLAPEQILGQPLDASTDLYALGVLLYQWLTGRLPFEGSDHELLMAHLHQAPRPLRDLNPRVSLPMEHLVLKLLAKNPNDRYASAQQVRRVFSSLIVYAEGIAGRHKVPLVGRDQPLQEIQACWREARAGRGQLVLISGEMGIGKTSLAQQAAAQSEPPVLLSGRCQELQGPPPPYSLFSQVLQSYCATVPPESWDESTRQLLGDLAWLVPEIRQTWPDLPEPPALEPEYEQLRLMSSLTRLVKHATQQEPWLILLDDLHWADSSSLQVLRYLVRHLPSMALLIIGAYCDVDLEPGHPVLGLPRDVSERRAYHHFALERLDQASVEQMLTNLWQQPAPPDLASKIYQHTGGNPLYVEEVARSLVDDGLIVWQEGWWHFLALDEVSLPPGVRQAAERRVRHLDAETRAVLRQAAVLGQVFKLEDLQEMSGLPRRQVLERLDVALERQLVQEAPGDDALRFRHVEIRRALYADLGALRRRTLHRRAGEALERHARSAPGRLAEPLTYHFGEAGEFDKAAAYGLQAAGQAQAAYANDDALFWYRRSLETLDQLDPDKAAQPRSAAQTGLGEVLYWMGRYDEALAQYTSARALVEAEAPTPGHALRLAHLHYRIAEVYEGRGEYDLALEWLDKGLSYLDAHEPGPEIVRIYSLAGWVRMRQGDHADAQARLKQALSLARAAQLRDAEADSLRRLGVVYFNQGDYARARAYYEQALRMCQEMGDRRGESYVLNNLGAVTYIQGDLARSADYHEQSLRIKRELGDRRGESRSLNNLGLLARDRGDYNDARAFLEHSLQIAREIGDRSSQGIPLANLGMLDFQLGDYVKARDGCEQSLRLRREIGDRHGESEAMACLGLVNHHLGDDETALGYARQALQIAQEIGDRFHQGQALTYLGHILAGLGQKAEAADAYQQALDIKRELGQPAQALECLAGLARVSPTQARAWVEEILRHLDAGSLDGADEPFRVYLTCYQVLRANHDPRARGLLTAAYTLLQERAARLSDAELQRSFLENVAAHRQIVSEWSSLAE